MSIAPEASPRNLLVLRGGADADDTTPGVRSPSSVAPMTVPERSRLAVAHWAGTAANGAGQLWLHPGRMVHVLWHGKPESMAEHYAYVRSREWVPPELGGRWWRL